MGRETSWVSQAGILVERGWGVSPDVLKEVRPHWRWDGVRVKVWANTNYFLASLMIPCLSEDSHRIRAGERDSPRGSWEPDLADVEANWTTGSRGLFFLDLETLSLVQMLVIPGLSQVCMSWRWAPLCAKKGRFAKQKLTSSLPLIFLWVTPVPASLLTWSLLAASSPSLGATVG